MGRPNTIATASLVALCAAALCAGVNCKSRRDKKSPQVNQPEPPVERRATSLSLQNLVPERRVTEFQPRPELPQQRPVVLEDAGKAPRRALRYALDQQAREITLQLSAEIREFADGTWRDPVKLSRIRHGIGVRHLPATDGAVVVQLRGLPAVVDAGPDKDERAAAAADEFLARYRSYMERRRASVPMDARGFLGALTLSPDAQASADAAEIRAQFAQWLLESTVPWPEEPIGPGAHWRATALLYRGRAVVEQSAKYELLSVDAKRARVRVDVTQIGEHQAVPAPELPQGVIAELVALFWRTQGELDVDLAAPLPVAGTLEVEMRVHGRTLAGGSTTDYFLDTKGALVVETAQVPAETPAPTTP